MSEALRMTHGGVRLGWCEECALSHAKATLYFAENPMEPVAIGEWNDGHGEG